jgi:hypothetical protein
MSYYSESDSESETGSAPFCVQDNLDAKNKQKEEEVVEVIGEDWEKGPLTHAMLALLQDVNSTEAQRKQFEELLRSGGDDTPPEHRIMMDAFEAQSGFENEDLDTDVKNMHKPMSEGSKAYMQLNDIVTYVTDNWRYMEAERAAKTSRAVIDWGDSSDEDSDGEARDDEASDGEARDDEASARKPAKRQRPQTGEAAAAMKRQRPS